MKMKFNVNIEGVQINTEVEYSLEELKGAYELGKLMVKELPQVMNDLKPTFEMIRDCAMVVERCKQEIAEESKREEM